MADNKKYYYMRLNENYFDTETQVLLESMPDGYLYSNILLKLYLKSLKNDGRLMFNEKIPYSPQMIATITRHQIGTVERALKIFKELNIIELIDSGAIYMLDIQNFIGKSNTEADRKRAYRNKIEREKEKMGHLSSNCPPEIEIELDIDINKKENYIKEKKFKKPTVEEVESYCKERKNNIDANKFVDYYDSIGWLVGKKPMKDWKACVRTWEKKEKEVKVSKPDISTPDWLNKKIEKQQDNLQELEDILKDFGG